MAAEKLRGKQAAKVTERLWKIGDNVWGVESEGGRPSEAVVWEEGYGMVYA
jgi:hypothetical protein